MYDSEVLLRYIDTVTELTEASAVLARLRMLLLPIANVEHISVWQEVSRIRWKKLCSDSSKFNQLNELQLNPKLLTTNVFLLDKTQAEGRIILSTLPRLIREQSLIVVCLSVAQNNYLAVLHLSEQSDVEDNTVSQLEALLPVFKLTVKRLEESPRAESLADKVSANDSNYEKLEAFAELASDWLWELDEDLRYTYLSAEQNETERVKYKHFLGKTPLDVRSEQEQLNLKKWGHWLHMVNQRQPILEFEYEVFDSRGQPFWIAIKGKPQFNEAGTFTGYIGTGRDINFSKQREVDLTKEREKAEYASAAKSHFLAVMSHEIRTPMNAILGMLELFEDTSPTERQSELIEFMRSSAKLLQGVITDTLDLAKIESGKLVLQNTTINLYALIKNLIKQFESQAIKQGLELTHQIQTSVPKLVVCDGLRLSQVLLNLLGNALKFTKHGSVSLTVSRSDSQLIFRVKDTGVGIPSEKLNVLYEPFTQLAKDQSNRQQGVGLGLSISKRLLTLMDGSIECQSVLGKYSEFIVTVPLNLPQSESPNGSLSNEEGLQVSKGVRILVAEDNVANQFVIQAILEKWNHTVTLVENGAEALEKLQSEAFDLVLMDMMMPVMDGVTASVEIRSDPKNAHLPIIALTANAGIKDKERCLEAGINEVLTKPIDSVLLRQKIEQFINEGAN